MYGRLRQHSQFAPTDLETLPPTTPPTWLQPGQPLGFGGDVTQGTGAGLAVQGMAKQMAYQNGQQTTNQIAHVHQQLYRVSRGVAKQRYGARQIVYQVSTSSTSNVVGSSNILPAYPQFKSLFVYTQAPGQVQQAFRAGVPSDRVRWPIPNSSTVATGA